MGAAGEGQMIAHQAKKLGHDALTAFRDRFQIPVSDEDLDKVPFLRFPENSEEMRYLRARREALGGYLPARRRKIEPLPVPPLSAFDGLLKATAEGREISTTMAFVRILTTLLRDKELGPRVVPIVPDESRTFGMEGLFRQFGIFSQVGQLYRPQDADQLMYYREDPKGQILQEGINEPGRMASFIAAGTSYSTSNVADDSLLHLLFDVRVPAGRRSRLGGGRHAHSRLPDRRHLGPHDPERRRPAARGRTQPRAGFDRSPIASTYDPTYAYELAVIVHAGLKRMLVDNEDVFYYITTLNENYPHPAMPEGAEEGILRGAYKLRDVEPKRARNRTCTCVCSARAQSCARSRRRRNAGRGARRQQRGLERHQLHRARREGLDAERWSMLHPEAERGSPSSPRRWPAAKVRSSLRPTI